MLRYRSTGICAACCRHAAAPCLSASAVIRCVTCVFSAGIHLDLVHGIFQPLHRHGQVRSLEKHTSTAHAPGGNCQKLSVCGSVPQVCFQKRLLHLTQLFERHLCCSPSRTTPAYLHQRQHLAELLCCQPAALRLHHTTQLPPQPQVASSRQQLREAGRQQCQCRPRQLRQPLLHGGKQPASRARAQ